MSIVDIAIAYLLVFNMTLNITIIVLVFGFKSITIQHKEEKENG